MYIETCVNFTFRHFNSHPLKWKWIIQMDTQFYIAVGVDESQDCYSYRHTVSSRLPSLHTPYISGYFFVAPSITLISYFTRNIIYGALPGIPFGRGISRLSGWTFVTTGCIGRIMVVLIVSALFSSINFPLKYMHQR